MTITPVAPITNIPQVPYPFVPPPFTDISPLTYRDGTTYLEYLKGLNGWIQNSLIPYIDNNLTALGQNYLDVANNLITTVNNALSANVTDIDALVVTINGLITEINTSVTAAQTSETNAANSATAAATSATDAAESAATSQGASDTGVAGLVDPSSDSVTSTTLKNGYGPGGTVGNLGTVQADARYVRASVDTDFTSGLSDNGFRLLQIREAPLTPYRFGAVDPLAVDNTAAIVAMFTAAANRATLKDGSEIYFPPGSWSVMLAQPLPLVSNMVVRGAGRVLSRLNNSVGSTDLFSWNTEITGVKFENMSLFAAADGSDIFGPGSAGGISQSVFENLFIGQQSDTGRIWNQVNNQSFISMAFRDVEMQRTTNSSLEPFYIVNGGGGANFNRFDNVRCNGSNNVQKPFIYIESSNAGAYAEEWLFTNLLGEQNPGGLLTVKGMRNLVINVAIDMDATVPYVNHVFTIARSSANLVSKDITLTGVKRAGSTLSAGINDIFLDNTTTAVLTACNPSTDSQSPSIGATTFTSFSNKGIPNGRVGTFAPENNVAGIAGDIYTQLGQTVPATYLKTTTASATGWKLITTAA